MKPLETKIDEAWIKAFSPRQSGIKWLASGRGIGAMAGDVLADLRADKKWQDVNWLVVRLMTHTQKVEWAIFAAEQVIQIFEKKYPDDKRPRNAIEAAKAWLKNPCEETKAAYAAAADAAYAAAAYAAYAYAAAYAAADAAADAARERLRNKLADKAVEILSL